MGAGNHVHTHKVAHARSSGGPGIGGSLYSAHITTNHNSHKAGTHLLTADQGYVGSLHHSVSSFHSTPMPSAVRVFTAMWRLLPLMASYSGASPL